MILVLLSYKVPLDQVDAVRPDHVDFLKQALADGRLLAAGRQNPPTGGVLIARGTLAEVQAWAMNDPYVVRGIADPQFVEMTTSLVAPGLEALQS
ncbi:YciI family protein [Sphingomonas sp. BGYR3]|uniref:YciI family protein n=1 Tax=Sphingomonas sp. BGYR3 TaxID=2975483 RepID=UPI0021A2B208|nr:YciI family protein [Sphingomonas sp. BGYR3]MDG5488376.1 YciI family protein [Sphingomonas sp. BGYR3]